ncbi:hypothetical protein REJC140_03807 [Pseudorhizobium endolithicum]|uniref:Uncharacterized protein n=1 Tax=Pseudorhizobium endolithicum TaxID=1191678 RepID=A0ABM8PRC6_9HYPH|nr:hypothetical protein [Pseudorhizobium endolithicum]CAD7044334.1 hypothetical protein REJC140_03807 [Pseudorhizobium endolithicum]
MNVFLVACVFAVTVALLGSGMLARGRIYEFPFLVGAITFGFILPQLPGVAMDDFLPDHAFARTATFTLMCLFMSWYGWSRRKTPFFVFRIDFDESRLLIAAALLSAAGAYFYLKLSRLPGDLVIGVQMSGVPVIYIFFSRLLSYGMVIAALCTARRPSWLSASILAFGLIFYLDRIIVTGKRAEAVELLIIFALALWFYRGVAAPRVLAVAGLLLGTLLMNSMGDYRTITQANNAPIWDDVRRIDVIGNFQEVMQQGGEEMRNAIRRIEHTTDTMQFDYGKFHWNSLIFSYVPAQVVGADFKQSMMLDEPPGSRDYSPVLGTTETGMADAFQSFWYFGAFKFFLLAYVMRGVWITANRGEFAAQFVYSLSIVPAMHAISHQTDWVLMVWVHMLIFAAPVLTGAIVPRRRPASSLRPV